MNGLMVTTRAGEADAAPFVLDAVEVGPYGSITVPTEVLLGLVKRIEELENEPPECDYDHEDAEWELSISESQRHDLSMKVKAVRVAVEKVAAIEHPDGLPDDADCLCCHVMRALGGEVEG